MTSWQTQAVCLVLRATRKQAYRTAAAGLRAMMNGRPDAPVPASLAGRLSTFEVAGFAVDRVHAASSPQPGVVVYFHGGAFVNGIAAQHWQLVEYLADATGYDIVVPHYGRAPRHDAAQARQFLAHLHAALVAEGGVHLAGDSAGGNLAMLMAQMPEVRPSVRGLSLIAPWLDLAMANPAIGEVETRDPWLARAGLVPIAEQWAGSYPVDSPEVSPLRGDLAHLPDTLVLVGSRDICLPDCLRLAELARGQAAPVRVDVLAGSPHVYPLLPTPEGRQGRAHVAAHIRRTLP